MPSINNEFIRFVVVGCFNTGHYYAVYLLCHHLLHFHYVLAHFTGFTLSLVGSFFLNTYYTYKVRPSLTKLLKFPLTQVVNTLATTLLLFVFIEWMQINSNVAPLIAVFFTIPITFIMTRRILTSS